MPKKAQKNEKPKSDLMVIKDETVDVVLSRVQEFQNTGELHLPANYSAANALKSAWLMLQQTVNKDKKPVLEVCSKASIANAMLDMVVQGLNPAKQQCYFIAYGPLLTLSRSYLGNKAISLRVDPNIVNIFAEVVYEGDEVEYEIRLGQRYITGHKQKLQNVDGTKIIAAYAVAIDKDDKTVRTELMTFEEIKRAWMQSRMNPITEKGHIKANTTHAKFTAEMAKKTVTNRMTKHIIAESDDSTLEMTVSESIARTDDLEATAAAEEEIKEKANQGDVIDIKAEPKKTAGAKSAKSAGPQNSAAKKDARDPEHEKNEPLTEEEKKEILAEEEAAALLNDPDVAQHVASGKPPF